jgi:hypoxanthine phosphoribosyltransferase
MQSPETLISEEEILARVDALAAQISLDYAGKGEIVLVGVLKGAFIFLADLSRRMIVDTGHTLHYLIDMLRSRNPASVRTCALLHKEHKTEVDVDIDYVGFSIGDEWVVGYGLDYDEKDRTLPYIGTINPEV